MKTLLLSLLLASVAAHAQTVLRVNNTGSAAPYTNINTAIAAAGVSDVIMVEGSGTPYAAISIDKKVTIIGPGYFLNENSGLQATTSTAYINGISFTGVAAAGSNLSGLDIVNIDISGAINIDNITVSNCRINAIVLGLQGGSASNWLVRSNVILSSIGPSCCPSGFFSNMVFANNLILGTPNTGGSGSGFTLIQNIFANSGQIANLSNSLISNNIFLSPSGVANLTGSNVKNNLFVSSTQTGVDASNLLGVDASSLFVGPAGNTTDTQYRLKAGSPAIGFGEGSADCGIFGGVSPYRPSGIKVGQPTVTNISIPVLVNQNGVLNVKVSGKVN
jgi:hypothetical protein